MSDSTTHIAPDRPVQAKFLGVWHKYVRKQCPDELICCSHLTWVTRAHSKYQFLTEAAKDSSK